MNPRIIMLLLALILTIGAASAACVDISAQNLNELIVETPSINSEIQACSPAPSLGPFGRIIGGNGALVIDVTTNTGTESFTLTKSAGKIGGFSNSAGTCSQKATMSEATLNTILSSSDRTNQALSSFASRDIQVNGCTFGSRVRLFFTMPVARFFARRISPPPVASGKPDGCDDTYLAGHRGYAQNQALWDSYSANTDAVCQQNRGIPNGCEHTVQLSIDSTPYYLCWYNR